MARTCPDTNLTPVIAAAERWRKDCWEGGQSILSTEAIWQRAGVDELQRDFVEKPLSDDRRFIDKLIQQLSSTSPATKKLAAEMLWVMLLFPQGIKEETKRQQVVEIWNLSGNELDVRHPMLGEPLRFGIGNAGQGYNQYRWAELRYFVAIMRRWLPLNLPERKVLLDDPWKFGNWLDEIPESAKRQFRHMLLFLLFPDSYERIASNSHKPRIVAKYQGLPDIRAEIDKLRAAGDSKLVQIDQGLFAIRRTMAPRFNVPFDYYIDEVYNEWGEERKSDAAKIDQPLTDDGAEEKANDGADESDQPEIGALFISRASYSAAVAELRNGLNVILQGPPGVGKTFVAARIAHEVAGSTARVERVQFHQSLTYDDFIQGYRPATGGGFQRRDGPFVRFCQRAQKDLDQTYVFVIEEINRGNLAKILGESLTLIEADKRDARWGMRLLYADPGDPKFYVPSNVHVLATMNTADRSIAIVDFALRRRFKFVTLKPEFSSQEFKSHLRSHGVAPEVVEKICSKMTELNKVIADDCGRLGPDYCVGHSFFCPRNGLSDSGHWYRGVVESQIAPLLREYWPDDVDRATDLIAALLA